MGFLDAVPHDKADICTVMVKNGSGGALAAGDVVIWDTTAKDGITINTIATAGSKYVAGALAEAIDDGKFGRMIIYGYIGNLKIDGGTTDVAAGDLLGTGGVAKYAFTATAVGTILGVALEAVTTKTTGKAIIRLG